MKCPSCVNIYYCLEEFKSTLLLSNYNNIQLVIWRACLTFSFLYFFFSFFLRASETVREYQQSFCTPGQRLFYYEPTHMLVLLLVWLPNGHMPKGARSLEVPEVWETLGGRKKRQGKKGRAQAISYKCIAKEKYGVDGKCRRCARACRAMPWKHLTLREKSEIRRAHAGMEPR